MSGIIEMDEDGLRGRVVSFRDVIESMKADAPVRARVHELYDELGKSWNTPRRWNIIREYYRLRTPRIEDADGRSNPYELGLDRFLTPIESAVWQDIRCIGLPFFMQYPVGRRFVDFGDPVRKIYIEADGARWHTPEKDAAKDAELKTAGWWGFRIKGRDALGIPGTNIMREIARYYGYDYAPYQEEEGYPQ